MAELTPMMQQYMDMKKKYHDCILFYRLGDFYEMFFEDALTASKELEITLTGKNCGLNEKAPMCGVPFHAVDSYLNRLIKKGYKVAICEQVEDPKSSKGIVKRDVIRVVTPGTNLNSSALEDSKNNYVMCIVYVGDTYGISIADITTGDYYVTEVDSKRVLMDEIYKWSPSEIICNQAFYVSGMDVEDIKNRLSIVLYALDSWYFDDKTCNKVLKEHFSVESFDGFGMKEYESGVIAAGSLLSYLLETQKNSLSHLTKLIPYSTGKFMILDTSTRRNLELTETLREKKKKGSLLGVLDKTKTAMGARMIRSFMEQPLIMKKDILRRQEAIEELNLHIVSREEIREHLSSIYDLERLLGRISYKTATPRDLVAFQMSVERLPHMKTILSEYHGSLLNEMNDSIDPLEDLKNLIEASIISEPPVTVKEGGMVKDGYHKEVDKLRKAKTEGKQWLSQLEGKERDRTGIKGLRIKFNRVFGYYIEVTNSYKNLVPEDYIRKQTLTNAERYSTPELKELEDVILGAEERLFLLEYDIFCDIRDKIALQVVRIQETAKAIAVLDVLTSLAYVAEYNHYVRPAINELGTIDIKDGRHPVVEQMIQHDMFVANDVYLDNKEHRISIITGPNMAGKSTYMRQTALIVLMAQIGSFVPAKEADIGICDRIFTRVGASDDLASGQSTFMVEMTEVANILKNATKNSLLILDEIGRGTSTFDGLSIAWAVVEHISNPKLLGAKTLFATHYHELTELEGKLDNVNNYCIAVKEQGDSIVFLRKIVKGGADKSYGIQVAKLAGVPASVIARAKELVEELSNADILAKAKDIVCQTTPKKPTKKRSKSEDENSLVQMSLFDTAKEDSNRKELSVIKELRGMDLENLTPRDALNILYQLQGKLKGDNT